MPTNAPKSAVLALGPAAPWRRRDTLVAALAVALVLFGLWSLVAGERGLDIHGAALAGGVPVTVYRPAALPVGGAPVVVIGHGFAGSRQLMQPFAVTLARNGYIAVSFDFPGHGRNANRLTGEIGSAERTDLLLAALDAVVVHARGLPGGDGRLALLGHSMAGDIMFRHAAADPDVDALVAVSPYLSQAPTAYVAGKSPRDLLFIYGEWEPEIIFDQGRADIAAVAGIEPDAVVADRTYGDLADGSARRLVIAEGVEHIGVLFSPTSLAAARDWLAQVFGRPTGGPVDARGPALGFFFAGVVLLAWPLSRRLPRVAPVPLGAGLGWRRFLPVALVPALLAPVLLWPLPKDFLPIAIGDYIALHFGLYGVLTALGLWLAGVRPTAAGVSWRAFAVATAALVLYQTLALMLPTDRFSASFVPGLPRLPYVLALLAGILAWAAADEWLTRGPGAPRAGYALTKVLFIASLMLAVVLSLNELFFLVIIIPAMLGLFVVYGLFSHWAYGSTNHPWVAAVANAMAFAAAVAVSFPIAD